MTVIISGDNGVSDVDGSAGTPAIRGTDANTGIFFPAADTIAFGEGGAEVARFDSSGNLGLGVTPKTYSNGKALQINTSALNDDAGGSFHITQNGYYNNAWKYVQNGTAEKITYGSGVISFSNASNNTSGADAALTWSERARITSGGYFKQADNGVYNDANGTYNEMLQTANNQALRMVASNASYTASIVECIANRNTTNNSFYAISYFNAGASAFKFRVADSGDVTNTNNSYGSISDVKLKQDIVDAASQWDDIKNLRVRKFHWKSDPDGFLQMGLVAQEAELVSPGLIDEHPDYEEVEVPVLDDEGNPVLNEDGTPQVTKERNDLGTTTKAIKYSVLYMKAVKALQEAMERIETLEAKVAALEAR